MNTGMLPPAPLTGTIFYDGHCGLSHHAVKFLLKQDRSGTAFRFAPAGGDTFNARIPLSLRANLPDSMIVQTSDGKLLTRSTSWIHVFQELGGIWKFVAMLMAAVPRPLRDMVYNFVARTRYLVFGWRDDVYPAVTPDLRLRFDA